jgi:UDP-N-acetylmuramoyl-tripeptide--D-alanyl-D-alanine ligase
MMEEVFVARWDAATIAAEVGARVEGDATAPVFAVTTDSRTAREGDAFFALDGGQVRGRTFVPNAFGSGCSVVVVDEEWTGEIPAGRAVLRVADPLAALGKLAAAVRASWSCPVLAITGSAGKTTVKEMTAHVCEAGGPIFKSPGNFNTVEGLSRAILSLETAPRVAVLEAGASKPGEIARLARIAKPTAAAITNIAAAHLEGFGTLADVAREKGDLLRAVERNGLAVVNGDDAYLLDVAAKLECRVLRVGFSPANDWRVVRREATPDGGSRFWLADGREGRLQVPGEHQLRNALTALALGEEAGVPVEVGLTRLATFASVAGRLVVRERAGLVVLDDTYNANPLSMRAALAVLAERTATRKAVVLGDMLELGAESKKYHADLGRSVADLQPDLAVFVGGESRAAFEEAVGRSGDTQTIRHAVDSDVAARILEAWVHPGDAVLVKGSRGMRMERVVRALVPGAGEPHAV